MKQIISLSIVSIAFDTAEMRRMNRALVYKKTGELRRWGRAKREFGCIIGVDNVNWPPYRDTKSFSVAHLYYQLR